MVYVLAQGKRTGEMSDDGSQSWTPGPLGQATDVTKQNRNAQGVTNVRLNPDHGSGSDAEIVEEDHGEESYIEEQEEIAARNTRTESLLHQTEATL
jgi:hypothetical protein